MTTKTLIEGFQNAAGDVAAFVGMPAATSRGRRVSQRPGRAEARMMIPTVTVLAARRVALPGEWFQFAVGGGTTTPMQATQNEYFMVRASLTQGEYAMAPVAKGEGWM